MSTKPPKKFDHLWREADEAWNKLKKHGRLIDSHVAHFRRQAYVLASRVLAMDEEHHNKFLAMVESEGKSVSDWMDQRFELIEAMGDDRQRLFSAIKAGMTEREWVQNRTVIISHKRIDAAKLQAKDDGTIPQPSRESKTVEERAEEYCDLYAKMVEKYRAVATRLRTTEQELGVTQTRLRRMERTILRLKKDIALLEPDRSSGRKKKTG